MKRIILPLILSLVPCVVFAQATPIPPEVGRSGSGASLGSSAGTPSDGGTSGLGTVHDDLRSSSTSTSTTSSRYAPSYPTNLAMRTERRVGAGTQVGGISGLFGFHMELNFEDENSAWAGFGFGQGFSTFGLTWKHQFEGQYFTPYTNLGWSRWYNSAGTSKPKSYILDATLHGDEKQSGHFGIDYVVGGGGLQFNQLDGDLQGASFFAEVDMLLPPFRGGVMPTASLGATYFF